MLRELEFSSPLEILRRQREDSLSNEFLLSEKIRHDFLIEQQENKARIKQETKKGREAPLFLYKNNMPIAINA
jgi:hypothetical protein